MNKPLPIIRDDSGKLIKDYTTYDWFNKLNEGLDEIKIAVWDFETNEYIDTYDEEDGSRCVDEKLQDFKIICTSMQTWLGYNEEMVNEAAKKYIKSDNTLEYKSSNEWIRALNVSLDQIKIDSFYDLSNSDEIIIDLLILIEICIAMQKRYCYLDDSKCNKICEEVNEKNHNLERRKQTMSTNEIFYIPVELTIKLNTEDIENIMVTAFEGGITYWCNAAEVVGNHFGKYASEHIARGGTLILHDAESSDKWELNREKLLKGVKHWLEANETQFASNGYIDWTSFDANDADCIIQYALFGKIVFG